MSMQDVINQEFIRRRVNISITNDKNRNNPVPLHPDRETVEEYLARGGKIYYAELGELAKDSALANCKCGCNGNAIVHQTKNRFKRVGDVVLRDIP